jgi:hypothetical protein
MFLLQIFFGGNQKIEPRNQHLNLLIFGYIENQSVIDFWKMIFVETEQTEPICRFKLNAHPDGDLFYSLETLISDPS